MKYACVQCKDFSSGGKNRHRKSGLEILTVKLLIYLLKKIHGENAVNESKYNKSQILS